MIPDSENPLDGDRYDWPPLVAGDRAATVNGVEVLRDLRPWPVRFEEQMRAIEERLQRLEAATGGDGASLLRWYDSVMKNPPFAEEARDGEGMTQGAPIEEQMRALDERVRRLEEAAGQPGRRIVMLYWRDGGQLATMKATVMHIKPDAPAVAVKALRAGMAAWVDEECAAAVVAEVKEGRGARGEEETS